MLGIFGNIQNPFHQGGIEVPAYYTTVPGGGLIIIMSNLIRLAMVIAGLYTLINIILAGYGFLSAGGDPKAIQKAQERIWRSVLGLLIVVGSLVFAAIIGYIIFGQSNWNIIISPRLYSP